MITLTEAAANQIKKISAENSKNLRIRVVGGGCSGFRYELNFDETRPDDLVFESFGVKVITDPRSFLFLSGAEIDYKEDLTQSGFEIKNPNIKGSCGCGSSFDA